MAGAQRPLRLGLDIGSTTVKLVLLDGEQTLFQTYRRHHADISGELDEVFTDVLVQFPDAIVRGGVTGSGGLAVAQTLELPFVQEVIAETETIRRHDPDADVIIELGGEDAKITYLKPTPEQRMNGSCAGGTGAFIDQMATLMHTDALGLDALAADYRHLYPIASRCGVFAKSDLQPLLNEGAPHEDLAASIFTSVVQQTIAGLACGRPIRGNVVLLGGPLHFLPQLRAAYARALGDHVTLIAPERAQLYVALGAAYLADGAPVALAELVQRSRHGAPLRGQTHRMRPLFADEAERADFAARHARAKMPKRDISTATGELFLGIDAGSTTIKAVLLNDSRQLLFSHYASNEGDPVGNAVAILATIRRALPPGATIARTCVTGYGEGLVKAALKADDGEIETMAHYRAADYLCPGVTSVIDIGGQDMKYLRVRNGVIDSIAVNEACSSGCGSFLQTFAQTMNSDVSAFATAALAAPEPVDLGSRCTVFMNSSVKAAQKEGAGVGEIAAGLSYSVVRNALYKVIKLKDAGQLGDKVVVQGGTFLNDAVLRAFELLTEREVVRPDIAGLMGAFGAALTARQRHHGVAARDAGAAAGESTGSRLLQLDQLATFSVTTSKDDCLLCQNHCQRTISTFADGDLHVTGNRCDRGEIVETGGAAAGGTAAGGTAAGGTAAGGAAARASARRRPKSALPNVVEAKYQRIFGYRRLTAEAAHRGDIGIPRALNIYENYPLWFTILSRLGFRVILSGRSSHEVFERGMDSIPSENVCYPAKLAHGHVEELIAKGVGRIFYPAVTYEQRQFEHADGHMNCPVVQGYPEVIRHNVESLRTDGVTLIAPFLTLADRGKLAEHLILSFAQAGIVLGEQEVAEAVEAGYAEDAAVRADVAAMGRAALDYMAAHDVGGIVLAGRPYHADPEIHHGIPEMINSLGMAVLTEDALLGAIGAFGGPDDEAADGVPALSTPLRVRDQWAYHSRLYAAAAYVATRDDLELVQLNSFGCGIDAITADQVAEILEARNGVYTALKIDEVASLGAARIRVRSLQAAVGERATARGDAPTTPTDLGGEIAPATDERVVFTREMRERHTLLLPQMAPIHWRLFEALFQRAGYRVKLLERASNDAMELGLKHVNNDACFPAIVVIGQLLDALRSDDVDPANTSVLISQTGGMCRATNYAALLRKALTDSGFAQVPVVSLSGYGLEDNPGFSWTVPMVHQLIETVILGDTLQTCLLRVRPYEATAGNAEALREKWDRIIREWTVAHGWSETLGRKISYRWLVRAIVQDFADMPRLDVPRRPRVGVVGEILVKYHPDANNDVIGVLEAEGCEVVLPGIMGFVLNSLVTADWNFEQYGVGSRARHVKRFLRRLVEEYQRPAVKALARSGVFEPPHPITELAEQASEVVSLGNQSGEGWYLVAEMVSLIEGGAPNIVCVQPFACLPNHVTGKGVFRELRRRYPHANIASVDYDPGASEVNQLNRIKLLVSTARHVAGLDVRSDDDWINPLGTPEPGSPSPAHLAVGADALPGGGPRADHAVVHAGPPRRRARTR